MKGPGPAGNTEAPLKFGCVDSQSLSVVVFFSNRIQHFRCKSGIGRDVG